MHIKSCSWCFMSSFYTHAFLSVCLSFPLNVRRECVCMNGHQTWRPSAVCTLGCMQEEQTGSSLSSTHWPCFGWIITPTNYIYPFVAGWCCLHNAVECLFSGNKLGSVLTTQKASLRVRCPALHTDHEQYKLDGFEATMMLL